MNRVVMVVNRDGVSASAWPRARARAELGNRGASKEDMLAAAGFKSAAEDRQHAGACGVVQEAAAPGKFTRQIRNGQVFYVYADPTVCVCVYVGDQTAYGTFRKNMFDKQVADEQLDGRPDHGDERLGLGSVGGWPYGWYYSAQERPAPFQRWPGRSRHEDPSAAAAIAAVLSAVCRLCERPADGWRQRCPDVDLAMAGRATPRAATRNPPPSPRSAPASSATSRSS